MEPFENFFDLILHLFDFIKNPIIRAVVQIAAMLIFTAILVIVILTISNFII